MKRVGEALHVSRTGRLVVKIEDPETPPRIGSHVYSGERRYVGTVVDVIGPVDTPYALVKPVDREIASKFIGSHLYVKSVARRKKGRHPSRRRKAKGKSVGA